jgi:hypothetical protein
MEIKLYGDKNRCITLCKFHPGYGGKFMCFITLNILCLNEKQITHPGRKLAPTVRFNFEKELQYKQI